MLSVAEDMVASNGLTVGLDHLRFEEVIVRADVPRSAAYRLWPYKDGFYADLLCRLAGPSWAGTAAFDEETIRVATEQVMVRADQLDTREGRRAAMLAACRVGAEQNFRHLTTSPTWRTYVALNATALSMPEGDLKMRVVDALRHAEGGFLDRMATFYATMSAVVGFRLRPEFNGDYRILAAIGAAVVEGLGLRNFISPDLVNLRFTTSKFSAESEPDWSVPSIGFTAIIDAVLEEDPTWTPSLLEAYVASTQ